MTLSSPPTESEADAQPALCPMCLKPVRPDARVCSHCRAWLREARTCPECDERISARARKCPRCQSDLPAPPGAQAVPSERLEADPLGAMVCEQSITALFIPPVMEAGEREVTVTRWALFGLRRNEQKVSTRRIASVRRDEGIFWASLTLETYGGSLTDLRLDGLSKPASRRMAQTLKRLTGQGD